MVRSLVNCIGIDDGPFERSHRGDVLLVGCVFSRFRMDGLLTSKVRRDGANSTTRIATMIRDSPFHQHVRAILMKGIAVAGFNVVDIELLRELVGVPVVVVARRPPNLLKIRRTLLESVPGGPRKWAIIERTGPMEKLGSLYVQRAGLGAGEAKKLIQETTLHGNLPEPLRVAHLLAGGLTTGVSRGRA